MPTRAVVSLSPQPAAAAAHGPWKQRAPIPQPRSGERSTEREGGREGELSAGAHGKDGLQARRVRAMERQKGFSFRTLLGTVVKHHLIQIDRVITLAHERESGRNNN